jgi:hypothetical protein
MCKLFDDLVLEVPGKDQDRVGLDLGDLLRRTDRDVGTRRKRRLLVRVRSTVKSMKSVRMPQ